MFFPRCHSIPLCSADEHSVTQPGESGLDDTLRELGITDADDLPDRIRNVGSGGVGVAGEIAWRVQCCSHVDYLTHPYTECPELYLNLFLTPRSHFFIPTDQDDP